MQWFLLSLVLSCGYMPQNMQMVNLRLYEQPCFTQTIEVSGLVAEHLNVYGSVRTYDIYRSGLSFSPFRADYAIGVEMLWQGFSLGIRHECDHAVLYQTGSQTRGFEGNETEIYLSFKSQWKIF